MKVQKKQKKTLRYQSQKKSNGFLELYLVTEDIDNPSEGIPVEIPDLASLDVKKLLKEVNNEFIQTIETQDPSTRIDTKRLLRKILRDRIDKELEGE